MHRKIIYLKNCAQDLRKTRARMRKENWFAQGPRKVCARKEECLRKACARPAQDAAQPQAARAKFIKKCLRARSARARWRQVRKVRKGPN